MISCKNGHTSPLAVFGYRYWGSYGWMYDSNIIVCVECGVFLSW